MEENKEWMTLLNVTEKEFRINPDIKLDSVNGSQLRLGIVSMLGYKDDSDVVNFHMGFRIALPDNKTLLSYGITFDLELKGWKDMSHKEADIRVNPIVRRMMKFCYPYLGGAMMGHTKGSKLEHFFLPMLDVQELMPLLIIKKISEEESE